MAETTRRHRPVRAVIYGLVWGLGLVVWLVFAQPVIGLDDPVTVAVQAGAVVAGAVVLSLLWAYLGPARPPKGPPPETTPRPGEH